MNTFPLSAVLITRDAATQLPACLAALDFCAEILVVDSGSTDETVEIARRAGARVIETHWRGFGPQKQFAVEQAAHDWVLCIDADERVSEKYHRRPASADFSCLSRCALQSFHGPLSEAWRRLSRLEPAPVRSSPGALVG